MDSSTRHSEGAADHAGEPPVAVVAEPRQRWRLVFARDEPGDEAHRAIADEWIARLLETGLPFPRPAGRPKPPIAFAAPLPAGVPAERELADIWLARRLPIGDVRPAIEASIPERLRLVDLFDVWLGAPALAAALVAADYRVELAEDVAPPDPTALARACADLLSAATLTRERARGSGTVRYDLRPLVADVAVAAPPASALRVRTRFHPERGAGRPEEVVGALGDILGRALVAARTTRERLVLVDEP